MSTARHDKMKLAKKLNDLKAALDDYLAYCKEIEAQNAAEEAGKDGEQTNER